MASFTQMAAAAIKNVPSKTHKYCWQSEQDRLEIVHAMNDANSGAVGKTPILLSATAKASFFRGTFSLFAIVSLPLTAGVKYPRRVGVIQSTEDGENYELVYFNISDNLYEKFLAMDNAAGNPSPTIASLETSCYTKEHYEDVLGKALATVVGRETPRITIAPQAADISTMKKNDGTEVSYVCLDDYVRVGN